MASIVNQDGKNKGMHMMGQTVLLELDRGDEVYVYTFTGSWTADWPHIHFTQFVGNISITVIVISRTLRDGHLQEFFSDQIITSSLKVDIDQRTETRGS